MRTKMEENKELKRKALNEKLLKESSISPFKGDAVLYAAMPVSFVCRKFAFISSPHALSFFEPGKCDSKELTVRQYRAKPVIQPTLPEEKKIVRYSNNRNKITMQLAI